MSQWLVPEPMTEPEAEAQHFRHSGDVLLVVSAPSDDALIRSEARLARLALDYSKATGHTYSVGSTSVPLLSVSPRSGASTRTPFGYLVAVLSTRPMAPVLTLPVVWGTPVGRNGVIDSREVAELIAAPERARELLGTWAIVGRTRAGLRLLNGPDLVHTWSRAEGPDGVAFSTQGLAAVVACGSVPRIDPSRICEFIHLEYVLGESSLLAGVRTVPEASWVDLAEGRDGAQEGRPESYWPIAERLAPGPPTTAATLYEHLTEDVTRFAYAPRTYLSLTAGRDSSLIANCLNDAGVVIPSSTIGSMAEEDPIGAHATTALWGSHHQLLTARPNHSMEFATVVRRSVWTEGMQTARITAGSGLVWGGPAAVNWLAGSGGEIGRAFYWNRADWNRADPTAQPSIDELVGHLTWGVSPEVARDARDAFVQHLRDELTATTAAGREGWSALDVLYARGRLRKWLRRSLPREELDSVFAGYVSPRVVQLLLNIETNARRSGRVFTEALGLSSPNFYEIAQSAVMAAKDALPVRVVEPARRSLFARSSRPGRLPGLAKDDPLIHLVKHLSRDGAVATTMGRGWVRDIRSRVESDIVARRRAWNALAVEALAIRLGAQ